jgi:hypothetical protein
MNHGQSPDIKRAFDRHPNGIVKRYSDDQECTIKKNINRIKLRPSITDGMSTIILTNAPNIARKVNIPFKFRNDPPRIRSGLGFEIDLWDTRRILVVYLNPHQNFRTQLFITANCLDTEF